VTGAFNTKCDSKKDLYLVCCTLLFEVWYLLFVQRRESCVNSNVEVHVIGMKSKTFTAA
jgi:hypothetical protein